LLLVQQICVCLIKRKSNNLLTRQSNNFEIFYLMLQLTCNITNFYQDTVICHRTIIVNSVNLASSYFHMEHFSFSVLVFVFTIHQNCNLQVMVQQICNHKQIFFQKNILPSIKFLNVCTDSWLMF